MLPLTSNQVPPHCW